MHWRIKALIQATAASLPNRLSTPVYYRLVRHFGELRSARIDPTKRMTVGMELCRQIVAWRRSPVDATFFEVGTGWRLNLPLACWLCGARRVVTVDLNPYLQFELIREDLAFLRRHGEETLRQLSAQYGELIDRGRWRRLLALDPHSLEELTAACGIEYLAPADASSVPLDAGTVDFHVSNTVFEHIPHDALRGILHEANRLLKPTGLLLHAVDHSDHFSHADHALSPIHFLQYSDVAWQLRAGGRYAYVNRLREDDYLQLFQECGLQLLAVESRPNPDVVEELQRGFPLDARFQARSYESLARLSSLFVLAPASASASAAHSRQAAA